MTTPSAASPPSPPPPSAWAGLLVGLVASGVAGIVNQVVWQRALKIFLGGSETLSAMIVVLVFLGGLGLGAAIASRFVPRLADPLRALAAVELGLAALNTGVALLLGLDITDSVYAVQRLALSVGLPLRAVYAVACVLLLSLPTLAMGTTVPLASEAAQRQLGARSSRLVPVLFFVNTVGAAFGAWSASAWLLPAIGQRWSLLLAVACNGAAGALIGALGRGLPASPAVLAAAGRAGWRPTREELLGGALGFLALGYEMALFRVLALAHQPLPTTFATGLAAFLLAWSLGMAVAGRVSGGVGAVAAATAAWLGLAVPALFGWERAAEEPLPLWVATGLYTLPCLGFGALYGLLVARAAAGEWGRDVGRYSAINTLGSCLGILFFTLVGYEMPVGHAIGAIGLGLVAVAVVEAPAVVPGVARAGGALVAALAGVAVLGRGFSLPYTREAVSRTYWGRDGVVQVWDDGNVWIDGLWHTKLTDGLDHVGGPYSWTMAFAAVAAHDGPPEKALVVGAGVGISSATLAGLGGLDVEGYEIDHTLQRVLRDYPEQTLHAASTPGIRWMWQDARTGLALNETKYDIILSAPLYLRQAGSSLLLSREYLRLAKSRLEEGGVLGVYSNEGSDAQTAMIQRTLAEMFRYRVTWFDGIVTIASDSPIRVDPGRLEKLLIRPDRLFREARYLDASLRDEGGLIGLYDGSRYTRELADRPIVDDQPLVEYPELADRWVGRVDATELGLR